MGITSIKDRLKFLFKKVIYANVFTKKLFKRLKFNQIFSGWGMSTSHYPPWDINSFPDCNCRDFVEINNRIISDVKMRKMNLLQFVEYNTEEILCELMWRHLIVFWSVRHALIHTSPAKDKINLVECGVCDGLTLRFAMESLASYPSEFKAFAYDAWAEMRDDLLLGKEKKYAGNYANISLQNTENNLKHFADKIVFIKGYIPESFDLCENPNSLIWLHIDLNSSKPTTDALAFFYERIPLGGVILFDDYGWHGYIESKQAIDKFLVEKGGSLLPLPTGQAIYFK